MDLHAYITLIKKNWLVLVAAMALGLVAAGGVVLTATPTYTASTRLYVSVPAQEGSASTDLNQGTSFARQAVASFVDVADSEIVRARAARALRDGTTAADLAGTITTASPANTVLIDISAVDADPRRAAKVANAVGAAFSETVIQKLEKPSSGAQSLIRVTTVQRAATPTQPSAPKVPLTIALGGLSGLAAGLAFAVLRALLDTRLRTVQQLEALTRKPFLGALYHDAQAPTRPLIVTAAPRDPKSEAFRRLRTNLQFVTTEGRRTFVITSSGPEEGKSYVAANLAVAIAETGASVVVVDGDLRRPRVAENFGIEGAAGLTDVLIGRAELDDMLQPWGRQGLAVLPSGAVPPNPSELLGGAVMQAVIRHLEERFEYVIIDAPPLLLVADAAVLSSIAGVLFVAASGTARKTEIEASMQSLAAVDADVLGTIATRLPVRGPDAHRYGGAYGYYATDSGRPARW